MPKEIESKFRTYSLRVMLCIGGLTLIGSLLFAWIGAGMYGSPFSGESSSVESLLLLAILVLGPAAILPCTLIEKFFPERGGIALCLCSILILPVLFAYNVREWGIAYYDIATGVVYLAVPNSLLGFWLLSTNADLSRASVAVRRLCLITGILLVFAAIYCFRQEVYVLFR